MNTRIMSAARAAPAVKESIQLLLSILSSCGSLKVSPETIRQAKFNNPSSLSETLHLLHFTLQLLDNINSAHPIIPFLLPPPSVTMATGQDERWLLVQTQKHLLSLGYASRLEFYAGNEVSSRETLIALGWVLLHFNIVERLAIIYINRLSKPLLPLNHQSANVIMGEVKPDLFGSIFTPLEETQLDIRGVERLTWIKGRLVQECRTVDRLCQTYHRLKERMREYTASAKDGPLSLHDIYFLRHPGELRSYLKESERLLVLIKQCNDWGKTAKSTVSNWLNSVLELSVKETGMSLPPSSSLQAEINSLKLSVKELCAARTLHLQRLETLCASSHRKTPTEKRHAILSLNVEHSQCTKLGENNCARRDCKSDIIENIPDNSVDLETLEKIRDANERMRETIRHELVALQEKMINTIVIVQGREK